MNIVSNVRPECEELTVDVGSDAVVLGIAHSYRKSRWFS